MGHEVNEAGSAQDVTIKNVMTSKQYIAIILISIYKADAMLTNQPPKYISWT